jgi:hypothetical protein
MLAKGGKPKDNVSKEPQKDRTKPAIPPKYAQPDQSDLRYTVEAAKDNVYNIDLKD